MTRLGIAGLVLAATLFSHFAHADNANRAAAAMKTGHYAEAIALYEADLKHHPFNAVTANNIAVAYSMKRQYSESLAWLKRATKMDQSRQDIQLNLETLQQWLENNSRLARNQRPVIPAFEGALSPEPPAPW